MSAEPGFQAGEIEVQPPVWRVADGDLVHRKGQADARNEMSPRTTAHCDLLHDGEIGSVEALPEAHLCLQQWNGRIGDGAPEVAYG